MNKKETVEKALKTYLGALEHDGNWGWPSERHAHEVLLRSIIDALPDEPPPRQNQHWVLSNGTTQPYVMGQPGPENAMLVYGPEPWKCGAQREEEAIQARGVGGPEPAPRGYCIPKDWVGSMKPVEVKASEPTSACQKQIEMTHNLEWYGPIGDPGNMKARCKNCGKIFDTIAAVVKQHPDGSTALDKCEERLIDQQIEEVKADKAKELISRITQYLSVGGLFNPEEMDHDKVRDLLIDCRRALNVILGQRSDPPATAASPYQLPEEAARKLRIIKAMEDLAKQHASIDQVAKFQFYEGNWEIVGSIGTQKINEFYSPEAGGHEATDERGSVETSALKEDIAKWSARALEQQHKCGELIGLVRYAAQKLRKHGVTSVSRKVSVRLHAILDSDPMGTAVPSGVPATPKSVSEEPLWEGELLVSSKAPEEFGRVYGGWHVHQRPEFGWRKIKVKEQR